MSRPKNPAQSYPEMVLSAEEKRASSRLYEGDETDVRLSSIISASAEELARAIDGGKVSLSDTEKVKIRGISYLRACADGACLPSMTGFARALGMTARALDDFKRRNPLHPTSDFLQMLHDAMADMLAEAAVRSGSGINQVFAIFLEKARFAWRDTTSIEISQPQTGPLGADVTADEISQKYLDLPEE